jgi:peptide/nickel transport system permease protein
MKQGEAVLEVLGRRKAKTFPGQGVLRVTGRLVREKPLGAFGAAVILALLLVAILADVIAPHSYDQPNFDTILKAPSGGHLLGTDQLGRDLFSRLVYGARVSIYVVLGAVTLSTFLTAFLGIVPTWYGGRWDTWVNRFVVDTWIILPNLLILLVLASLIGPGLFTIIFILGLGGIGRARIIRGAVLSLKEQPFIDAAQAIGASTPRIILQHILPNTFAPLIILATIDFGRVILAEATLSFLGYGIPPPFPSWGRMLGSESISYFYQAPWLVVWPGVVLSAVVFGSNVFGDALRDMLDPRLKGAGRAGRLGR